MSRSGYRGRIADAELLERLESASIVVVEGAKACGKTSTARQAAASEVLLDVDDLARQAVAVDPTLVLAGESPRLIDEWQTEPVLWNHVRRAADDASESGRFILTGSAVPADDITRHTGAGRISRLRLRSMTLSELDLSSGEISLRDLLRGLFPKDGAAPSWPFEDLVTQLCRGGWPGDLRRSDRACLRARTDYLDELRRVDISRADGVRRDPEGVGRLLRSLARNVATQASASTLAKDARGDAEPLHEATVRSHLDALGRLMVYEEQTAWAPHLRSRSALRQAPKRHFMDPSLAAAALGATPARLLAEPPLLGMLFESLVYHELVVYAGAIDATVHHYRDNTGLEVDAVVQTRQGDWCAFEAKLGVGQVDAAATTLLKFKARIDETRTGPLRMLGVIIPTGYGFLREDGVAVVPLSALGP